MRCAISPCCGALRRVEEEIPFGVRQTVYGRIMYMQWYKVREDFNDSSPSSQRPFSSHMWPYKPCTSQPKTCSQLPDRPPSRRACTRRAAASPPCTRNKAMENTISVLFNIVQSSIGIGALSVWIVRSHSTQAQRRELLDLVSFCCEA